MWSKTKENIHSNTKVPTTDSTNSDLCLEIKTCYVNCHLISSCAKSFSLESWWFFEQFVTYNEVKFLNEEFITIFYMLLDYIYKTEIIIKFIIELYILSSSI